MFLFWNKYSYDTEIKKIRKNAENIAEKALWKHFITYYYQAYDVALRNAQSRLKR